MSLKIDFGKAYDGQLMLVIHAGYTYSNELANPFGGSYYGVCHNIISISSFEWRTVPKF